jgi:hypothetical protein
MYGSSLESVVAALTDCCVCLPLDRSEVTQCNPCVKANGCGFCLSTLRCLDGGEEGPSDGSPCPNWLFSDSVTSLEFEGCPGEQRRAVSRRIASHRVASRRDRVPSQSSCERAADCLKSGFVPTLRAGGSV